MTNMPDETIGGDRIVHADERSPDGHQGRKDKRQCQAAEPDNNRPEEDPAEGSRDTVEHELDRQKQSDPDAPHGEAKRARDDLQEQVKQEIEWPQRGSA
ncbi:MULTISPECIES: hypothetical protein [Mesorhizobium]|uniref:hypothetical protein n=1 Tax=Mesorhizobium sp. TaxID=1871066 RepID=UPI0004941ACE|nr:MULTISPECIES: hypothetical protein [Mesorhizobium]RWL14466.1 MAG: hypothetical protein EOR57_31930 [Mesorhizobium sp.]RWM75688.1 MAG: hypothetical protein EOR82_03375 [Mesorhizobium sp.]TIO25293.1 MAG: hypothetical protein E5X83_13870 [Mesorhizobium sp.]TJV58790.1 MAG: hypothetical protein E5X82_17300 [Mesorhizobium sp.]